MMDQRTQAQGTDTYHHPNGAFEQVFPIFTNPVVAPRSESEGEWKAFRNFFLLFAAGLNFEFLRYLSHSPLYQLAVVNALALCHR
jgi:hypothetical protein